MTKPFHTTRAACCILLLLLLCCCCCCCCCCKPFCILFRMAAPGMREAPVIWPCRATPCPEPLNAALTRLAIGLCCCVTVPSTAHPGLRDGSCERMRGTIFRTLYTFSTRRAARLSRNCKINKRVKKRRIACFLLSPPPHSFFSFLLSQFDTSGQPSPCRVCFSAFVLLCGCALS